MRYPHPLSTIVFNPDTTEEAIRLMRDLEKHLHATRDDWLEFRRIDGPCPPDGSGYGSEESTLYVIAHTGNLLDMIAELTEADLL